MKKTYSFASENGTFVCFNEYSEEDDFPGFRAFLARALNTVVPSPQENPYSLTSEFKVSGRNVVAMFHGDSGCCIRVEPGDDAVAEQIVRACYGE